MYLITRQKYKKGYISFRRLLKEEMIEEICNKYHDNVPDKKSLPASICLNQIHIEEIEVDERV